MDKKRVFISHASEDRFLLDPLVDLIQSSLNLPDSAITYTSCVYRGLQPGETINPQLVELIRDAAAFVVIVSPQSMASDYVKVEIGIRLGAKRTVLSVLSPGTSPEVAIEPIRHLHHLTTASLGNLRLLITELAKSLDIDPATCTSSDRQLDRVLSLTPADAKPDSDAPKRGAGLSPAARELLLKAIESRDPIITHSREGTALVATGGHQFVALSNAGSKVRYLNAVDELQQAGLLEQVFGPDKFGGYESRVTQRGHEVAEALRNM